ncbi:MAG: hypothetical protein H0X29_02875, partial [Parachlamydiaceae bacterium]|nr:hypothetical protein [Parachlamydiaceae bacterium]
MIPPKVVEDWAHWNDVDTFIDHVLTSPEDLSLGRQLPLNQRCAQVSRPVFEKKVKAAYKHISKYLEMHKAEFKRINHDSLHKLEENIEMISLYVGTPTFSMEKAYNKAIQVVHSLQKDIIIHTDQSKNLSPMYEKKEVNEQKEESTVKLSSQSKLYEDKEFVKILEYEIRLAQAYKAPREEIELIISRAEKLFLNETNPHDIKEKMLVSIKGLGTTAILASKYGNKTANLQRLANNFQANSAVNSSTQAVMIPKFRGIAHQNVLEFIQQNFPEFNYLWSQFTSHMEIEGSSIELASEILIKIQAGIKQAFSTSETFPPEADIAEFVKLNKKMIVRSTGKEDTLKVANPGGNDSIDSVPPTRKHICAAIGEVVASYFSARSLGQRQASGDDITQDPFMPVLLQVMVVENHGDMPTSKVAYANIPASGVMYTTEGSLGTEGVVQISAGFGGADGIVTGSMPSDIFYKQGDFLHGIVKDKPLRRAPGEAGKLANVENPPEIVRIPSLTQLQINHLADIGNHLQEIYGFPLDIEWTIDRNTGVLYLLQARPIAHQERIQPSYIEPEKIKELENLQQVIVAEAGGGSVRILNQKNAFTCQTAKNGVDKYLANLKHKPEAIFIAEPSAPNSHEAGFCRERGIPLIYLPGNQYKATLSLLKTHHLLLDTQEGFIAQVPDKKNPSEYISVGLRRHLAPKSETLLLQASEKTFEKLREDLKVQALLFNDVGLKLSFGWNIFDKLLNSFEEAESLAEKGYLLESLLRIIEKRLLPKIPENERDDVWNKILFNARHVWSACNDPNADVLNNKFAMNWLRGSILQRPAEGIVGSETLHTTLGAIKERKILSIKGSEALQGIDIDQNALMDIFQRSEKFILTPNGRKEWASFIKNLDFTQMQQLADLFKKLGFKVIETWLNSSFIKSWYDLE